MGSLTSRPEIPQAVSPVIVTVPSSVASTVDASAGSSGTAADAELPPPSDETIKARAREDGLLSRSRGGFSTILTGFTGLLSDTAASPARKTLLGE